MGACSTFHQDGTARNSAPAVVASEVEPELPRRLFDQETALFDHGLQALSDDLQGLRRRCLRVPCVEWRRGRVFEIELDRRGHLFPRELGDQREGEMMPAVTPPPVTRLPSRTTRS